MAKKSVKEMLINKEFVCAIGVGNALEAKLVEAAGFDCLYMTGYGVVAENFGYPDIGLVTMSEMAETARRITNATDLPLIADADTGYGNSINVRRTVQEYEAAGVSVIQFEDQTWPKRCGHMEGKKLMPANEMVANIKSAVDTRKSDDFLIIARTDAVAVEGFDAAIERGKLYAENGADIVFVEAPTDMAQVQEIPKQLAGIPTLYNLSPKSPDLSKDEVANMGFAVAIYPCICIAPHFYGIQKELEAFKETGLSPSFTRWAGEFGDINNFLGLGRLRNLEEKYLK